MAVLSRVCRVGEMIQIPSSLGFDNLESIQGKVLEESCRPFGRMLQALIILCRVGEDDREVRQLMGMGELLITQRL